MPEFPNHNLTAVPVREQLTATEFETAFVSQGIPVVIERAMESWPAVNKWSLDHFASHQQYSRYAKDGVTLKEYIAYIQRVEAFLAADDLPHGRHPKPHYHSHDEDFFEAFGTSLWKDVDYFPMIHPRCFKNDGSLLSSAVRWLLKALLPALEKDWIQGVWWLGPTNAYTALHYDDDPVSVLYQVLGRKVVYLYSPDQSKWLYPQKDCGHMKEFGTRWAAVQTEDPRLDRFPLFSQARALVVELEPGQGLYIPSGWWHEVRVVEGPAISVAGRSYTLCEGLSYIPNFLMLKAVELGLTEPSSFCINPDYIDQI